MFITLGFARSDVVHLGQLSAQALEDGAGRRYPVQQTAAGAVAYLENLPAKGYVTLRRAEGQAPSPFLRRDDFHLETPYYSVTLDSKGRFASLLDKEHDRELMKPGTLGNLLRVYEDKPIYYDNWDIDRYYTEKHYDVEDLHALAWTEDGPVQTTLELCYGFCGCTLRQRIHFYANTRRIDFETVVDWKLHQHLLKAEFPLDIHTDEATFDVQFGNVTRKVHANTSWDKARFESCGQKWMDYSEGHYGVSLLNDCKYGHSVLEGVVALTLIKRGVEPNPNADVETHRFTYALYPHGETWKQAGTVRESYKLNQPAYVLPAGTPGKTYSYAAVDKSNVILETVKQAEDGQGTILRLYECENARTKFTLTVPPTTTQASITNLLEEPQHPLTVTNGQIPCTIHPYEILTIRIR